MFFVVPYLRVLYYSLIDSQFKRNFVRLAAIQTGEENGNFIEVVSGIGFSDRIASENTGELYDGCEVNIVDRLK